MPASAAGPVSGATTPILYVSPPPGFVPPLPSRLQPAVSNRSPLHRNAVSVRKQRIKGASPADPTQAPPSRRSSQSAGRFCCLPASPAWGPRPTCERVGTPSSVERQTSPEREGLAMEWTITGCHARTTNGAARNRRSPVGSRRRPRPLRRVAPVLEEREQLQEGARLPGQ